MGSNIHFTLQATLDKTFGVLCTSLKNLHKTYFHSLIFPHYLTSIFTFDLFYSFILGGLTFRNAHTSHTCWLLILYSQKCILIKGDNKGFFLKIVIRSMGEDPQH